MAYPTASSPLMSRRKTEAAPGTTLRHHARPSLDPSQDNGYELAGAIFDLVLTSKYLRKAEAEAIVITRRGKPAGVLVSF